MSSDRLIYLPLGGAGEIGMNAYVYGYGPQGKERLILVDLGVTFPDMDTTPGVDLIMPDITWLKERADRLEGIFITHGHEDHIGAIAHLYAHLNVPSMLAPSPPTWRAARWKKQATTRPMCTPFRPGRETTKLGPFTIGVAPMSHSIPEAARW